MIGGAASAAVASAQAATTLNVQTLRTAKLPEFTGPGSSRRPRRDHNMRDPPTAIFRAIAAILIAPRPQIEQRNYLNRYRLSPTEISVPAPQAIRGYRPVACGMLYSGLSALVIVIWRPDSGRRAARGLTGAETDSVRNREAP